MERGRHGGIFMGRNATGLYAALEFRCILFICLKRGRAGRYGGRRMTEMRTVEAAVCDLDEVTSNYPETYFPTEERRDCI